MMELPPFWNWLLRWSSWKVFLHKSMNLIQKICRKFSDSKIMTLVWMMLWRLVWQGWLKLICRKEGHSVIFIMKLLAKFKEGRSKSCRRRLFRQGPGGLKVIGVLLTVVSFLNRLWSNRKFFLTILKYLQSINSLRNAPQNNLNSTHRSFRSWARKWFRTRARNRDCKIYCTHQSINCLKKSRKTISLCQKWSRKFLAWNSNPL